MRMFNRRFKPIGQAIGLVAVLVLLLTVPGVTQQENPLSRQGVVNVVNEVLGAALTAAEGDILDPDNATFISTDDVTLTYVPLARESRSAQRLIEEVFSGEDFAPIFIGTIFVDQHPILPQGLFQMFLTSEGVLRLVDQDGSVVEVPGEIPQHENEVDLASVLWKPTFGFTFKPAFEGNTAVPAPGSCSQTAFLTAAGCEVETICSWFEIFGWRIWESCHQVLICD
jgi:hypothetical protein